MTLDEILAEATTAMNIVTTIPDLEQAKARFLGKTGSLTEQLKALGIGRRTSSKVGGRIDRRHAAGPVDWTGRVTSGVACAGTH